MTFGRQQAGPGPETQPGARAEIHFFAGLCYATLGRADDAARSYRAALALAPTHTGAENHLGLTLEAKRHWDEALRHYKRAVALRPNYKDALNNLGTLLAARDQHRAAMGYLLAALSLPPHDIVIYANLGRILLEMGRMEAAAAVLDEGLRHHPDSAQLHLRLSEVIRFLPDSPQFAALERLSERMAAPDGTATGDLERATLTYALAKAHADIGRPARAFSLIRWANALQRRHVAYDEADVLATLDRIPDRFSAAFLAAHRGHGHPSALPVFIIGMPRSGSTLVEQILASHPLVASAGETPALDHALERLRWRATYPDCVAASKGIHWHAIGAAYLEEIATHRSGPVARISDKRLSNAPYAGLIHLALPNARLIHVVRDPVDTCLSCFSHQFVDVPYSYDLGELGRYYRHHARLMAHWQRVLPARTLLEIRYEDVVADPEGQARRILAHCGLPWDPACLAFHRSDRPVRTTSATQVRRPIYTDSVGRWRPNKTALAPLLREWEAE